MTLPDTTTNPNRDAGRRSAPGDHTAFLPVNRTYAEDDAAWFAAHPGASCRIRLASPAELDGVRPELRATRVMVVRTQRGRLARFPMRLREPHSAVEALREAAEQEAA